MAFFEIKNSELSITKENRYISNSWVSISEMMFDFMSGKKPDRISISFAGPVKAGKAAGTNLNWGIDIEEIKQK